VESLVDRGCMCEFYTITTKQTSHFATFPPKLVEPCIKAGTSEKGCCRACGAPWARETEKEEIRYRPNSASNRGNAAYDALTGNRGAMGVRVTTAGWRPSCSCDAGAPVPCVVLDPFAGAGTVAVVATGLGRRSIGCDLNPDYLAMARRRIDRPHARIAQTSNHADDLPLFVAHADRPKGGPRPDSAIPAREPVAVNPCPATTLGGQKSGDSGRPLDEVRPG
jgi:hypothetical protein